MSIAPKESTISVEGYVHPLGEGQVRLQKQTVVEATQITANGQSFLVRYSYQPDGSYSLE